MSEPAVVGIRTLAGEAMLTGMSIFVTGGAGFIANRLIRELINHNEITVYDNFHRDTLTGSPIAGHQNLTVITGDVLDVDKVRRSMAGADVVIHAAAVVGIDTVVLKPTRTMTVNMVGTANVLEAALINRVSHRVLTFSTSEVLGSMAFKSTEDSDTVAGSAGEARWTYAVSKLAGEHLAAAYHSEFGLPTVSVRPFNVYGPGQTGEGAIHAFIRRALVGADLEIYGDGSQIRAWCYIDDFADCLMACLESPAAVGQSFNIGNARAVMTTYGLAQTVCRVLDSDSKIVFRPPLSAEIELRIPSVNKARRVLDFESQEDLDEGIRRTAVWITENEAPISELDG